MFSGAEIAEIFARRKVTDVVWLPDSAIGPWEREFEAGPFRLIRVCREGEAWPIAAGLSLGGRRPVLVIQSTGLFESGDALRNILFDFKIPLFTVIGARSFLLPESKDTAKTFLEPILKAWGIDYVVITGEEHKPRLETHLAACLAESRVGAALIGEGRM